MSRLSSFSAIFKSCRPDYSNGRILQTSFGNGCGMSFVGRAGNRRNLEVLRNHVVRHCRNIHAVRLAQPELDIANGDKQECDASEHVPSLREGSFAVNDGHSGFAPQVRRFQSATRLPADFFRDLNRLIQSTNPAETQIPKAAPYEVTLQSSEGLSAVTFDDIGKLEAGTQQLNLPDTTERIDFPAPSLSTVGRTKRLPKKVDLSYVEPLSMEKAGLGGPLGALRQDPIFRSNSHSDNRRLAKIFMEQVYKHVPTRSKLLDRNLKGFIRVSGWSLAERELEQCVDFLTWTWILLGDGSTAVKRLMAFVGSHDEGSSPYIPLWVVLQLLRSERIDARPLQMLISYIAQQQHRWRLRKDNSAMVITVRLLRHARLIAPSCYESITKLFIDWIDLRRTDEGDIIDPERVTHWCNRILSLIAIQPNTTPYRSVLIRQACQLSIIGYMQDSNPEIPLTREGFRSLASVQLMHAKTESETEWAEAKVLTWPPFQNRHRMGFSSNEEYIGKQSRVMKVLQRMKEAGYGPHDYDIAVQILAGWEADMTPTIQTRTTPYWIQKAKLWEPGTKYLAKGDSPIVWSARIQATRTVREAWMCFSAYLRRVDAGQQRARVFHAMFVKLISRSVQYTEDGPVPGDGRETFPDPDLQRDLVYIPEDIPTPSEFFSKMVEYGLKPYGRFLIDLLGQAPTLEQGFEYIKQSQLPDRTRQVLTDPGAFRYEQIAEVISGMPDYLIRGYIALLARPYASIPGRWYHIPTADRSVRTTNGYHHVAVTAAKWILITSDNRNIWVWNAYLKSLMQHTVKLEEGVRRLHISDVWRQMVLAVSHLQTRTICNFETFGFVANVAFKLQTLSSPASLNERPMRERMVEEHTSPTRLTKRLFIQAATGIVGRNVEGGATPRQWHRFCTIPQGNKVLHSVPTGDNIESMVWLIAVEDSNNCVKDIMDFLRWLAQAQVHDQIAAAGHWITKHNMCAFRILLEGRWGETVPGADSSRVPSASPDQLREAKRISGKLGWPNDETVEWYLKARDTAFESLYKKIVEDSKQKL